MRLVKTGLIAAAILVVFGIVGSSGAMGNATNVVLCQNAELVCENPFGNPTTIVTHATGIEMKSTVGTVKCAKSLYEITLLNTLSTLLVGHVLALSFGDCVFGKTACTVTADTLGLLSFTKSGALSGVVESTGGTKFTINCGSLLKNCHYGGQFVMTIHTSAAGETKLLASGGSPEEGEAFICPDSVTWIGTYTALGTMWLES